MLDEDFSWSLLPVILDVWCVPLFDHHFIGGFKGPLSHLWLLKSFHHDYMTQTYTSKQTCVQTQTHVVCLVQKNTPSEIKAVFTYRLSVRRFCSFTKKERQNDAPVTNWSGKKLDLPFLCYNTSQRRKFEENSTEGNLCWREVVFFIWQQLCLPSTSQREPQCFLNDEQRVKMSEASGSLGGPSRGSSPRRNTRRRRGRDVSHLSQKKHERRGWKGRDEKQMRNMTRKK